ncbi:MAG: hypothetical protein RI932_2047 [Pseudomonadota bacterium]
MRVISFSLALLCCSLCPVAAGAFVLLQDEFFPRADFSERALVRESTYLRAQMLSGAGQDRVEALVNQQTETRIFAALGLAVQSGFGVTEKLRVDLRAQALRSVAQTEVNGSVDWKKNEVRSELLTSGLVRFLLSEGLRIGAGAHWVLRPAAEEDFVFAGETGKTSFAAFNMLAPEYVLSKESGAAWSVGIAWRPEVSRKRSFVRVAAAEESSIEEDVELDELWSAGIQAQIQSGRQLNLDFVLTGIGDEQKRDTSTPASANSNASARRRYGISGVLGLGEWSGHNLALGVGYQSVGYTEQGQVSPQNIPLWTLLLRDELKWNDLNARFDALLGLGRDKQSLPDLNADYRRIQASLQAGIVF